MGLSASPASEPMRIRPLPADATDRDGIEEQVPVWDPTNPASPTYEPNYVRADARDVFNVLHQPLSLTVSYAPSAPRQSGEVAAAHSNGWAGAASRSGGGGSDSDGDGDSDSAPPANGGLPALTSRSLGLQLAETGFRVFPLRAGAKAPPLISGWPEQATDDAAQVSVWADQFPGCNWGIATGNGLSVVDIDPRNGGTETWAPLVGEHGEPEPVAEISTPSGGRHLYFKDDPGAPLRHGTHALGAGVDVKGAGGYVVAFGCRINRREYRPVREDYAGSGAVPEWMRDVAGLGATRSNGTGSADPAPGVDMEERARWVQDALEAVPNGQDFESRDAWIGMAHRVNGATGGGRSEEGFTLFDAWSEKHDSYDPRETRRVWDTLPPSALGYASLEALARSYGYERPPSHPESAQNVFEVDPDAVPPGPSADHDSDPVGHAWDLIEETKSRGVRDLHLHLPKVLAAIKAAGDVDPSAPAYLYPALSSVLRGRGFTAREGETMLSAARGGVDRPPLRTGVDVLAEAEDGVEPVASGSGFFPGHLTTLVGPSESGKTSYTLASLAQQDAPVLVWMTDDGEGRAARIFADAGGDLSQLYFLDSDESTPSHVRARFEEVSQTAGAPPAALVIDSLTTNGQALGYPNANEAEDVAAIMHPLRWLAKDTGLSVVLIHNTNRGGTWRGSAVVKDASDVMLLYDRPNASSRVATVKREKDRTGTLDFKGYKVRLNPDGSIDHLAQKDTPEDAFAETTIADPDDLQFVDYLRTHGASDRETLQKALGIGSRNTFNKLRDRLREDGSIVEQTVARGKKVYALPDPETSDE